MVLSYLKNAFYNIPKSDRFAKIFSGIYEYIYTRILQSIVEGKAFT